jgi:hypothetical protein
MTPESRESIMQLFGWISDAYQQNPASLLGHRDYFGTTACPGDNVWYELPSIRIDIVDYIESMAFAWLAYKRINKQEVDLCDVTGASKNSILGGIYG